MSSKSYLESRLVCITQVIDSGAIEFYQKQGYDVDMTVNEFRRKYPEIDPKKIFLHFDGRIAFSGYEEYKKSKEASPAFKDMWVVFYYDKENMVLLLEDIAMIPKFIKSNDDKGWTFGAAELQELFYYCDLVDSNIENPKCLTNNLGSLSYKVFKSLSHFIAKGNPFDFLQLRKATREKLFSIPFVSYPFTDDDDKKEEEEKKERFENLPDILTVYAWVYEKPTQCMYWECEASSFKSREVESTLYSATIEKKNIIGYKEVVVHNSGRDVFAFFIDPSNLKNIKPEPDLQKKLEGK